MTPPAKLVPREPTLLPCQFPPDAVALFHERIMPEPNSGCWLWTGSVSGSNGSYYGTISINGRSEKSHRFAYMLYRGPIPSGLELDHLCRVTECANPFHLEAVTHAENIRRGTGHGAACLRGHQFTDANVYITPSGKRNCRACKNLADKRRRAK